MAHKWFSSLLHEIDFESDIIPGVQGGFLLSLMVLSSYIIQADGRIMHSEMEFMRNFLETTYGAEKKAKYETLLLAIFQQSKKDTPKVWTKKVEACAKEIADITTPQQRRILLAYLIKIVRADNKVMGSEVQSIDTIANWLGIGKLSAEEIDTLQKESILQWENLG